VTESRAQYVDVAASLAEDLAGLQELRLTLASECALQPLMDAAEFTRAVDAAYHECGTTYSARKMFKRGKLNVHFTSGRSAPFFAPARARVGA